MFDLLTERYEDLFESDPEALRDSMRDEDGEIVFDDIEDELIQKWENELAAGLTPDLTEGLSKTDLEKMQKNGQKIKRAKVLAAEIDDSDLVESLLGQSNRKVGGANDGERTFLRNNTLGSNRVPSVDNKRRR